jgi:deoxyhypusine synthase
MAGVNNNRKPTPHDEALCDTPLNTKQRQTVMLGLAGPLIAAGLRNVVRDLIVSGYVDVVVSTGAIMFQDIYQARRFMHYRSPHEFHKLEMASIVVKAYRHIKRPGYPRR